MGKFKKMYMRPNQKNNGDVPAEPYYSECPDIWISGDQPVVNHVQVLATPESYARNCETGLVVKKNNYIYVRGKNGNDQTVSNNVTLYFADGAVIQWPSKWLNNIICTDIAIPNTNPVKFVEKANINVLKPGEVGVVDNPFVWRNVPPYVGTCHYCLIAQFNDAGNSNPVPRVDSAIDMGKLVQNNLQWGWRNVTTMEKKEDIEWGFDTSLSVPKEIKGGSQEYMLLVKPTNVPLGCEVSFVCSKGDADGKPIKMNRTKITGDGVIVGCTCKLKEGFDSMISVSLHNPQHVKLPTDLALNFEADYYSSVQELEEHDAMFLYQEDYTKMIQRKLGREDGAENRALVRLGAYTGVLRK